MGYQDNSGILRHSQLLSKLWDAQYMCALYNNWIYSDGERIGINRD